MNRVAWIKKKIKTCREKAVRTVASKYVNIEDKQSLDEAIKCMRKAVDLATDSLRAKVERAPFDWAHPYSM